MTVLLLGIPAAVICYLATERDPPRPAQPKGFEVIGGEGLIKWVLIAPRGADELPAIKGAIRELDRGQRICVLRFWSEADRTLDKTSDDAAEAEIAGYVRNSFNGFRRLIYRGEEATID